MAANPPQFAKRTCRPRDHLAMAGRLYPEAWSTIDEYRQQRGQAGTPDWPDWCFLPMQAYAQIIADDARIPITALGVVYPERMADVARLSALGAWRVTQGIYRFDPAVYEAVRTTAVGDLPADVLYRLPEWCVYLETPAMQYAGDAVHGVFAHLEFDTAAAGRHELRLLLDTEQGLAPMVLHLGAWSLGDSIERMLATARAAQAANAHLVGLPALPDVPGTAAMLQSVAEPIISMLLYLCSQADEVGAGIKRPAMPSPVRTKRGWRLFPADKSTTWDVGVRMGAALRAAYQAAETAPAGAEGGSPRGHIRRAHWHGFRSGPRTREDGSEIPTAQRRFDLRWLPPIAVNLPDVDQLPAVVRTVR